MTLCSMALCQMPLFRLKIVCYNVVLIGETKKLEELSKNVPLISIPKRVGSSHLMLEKKQGPRNSSIFIKDFSGNPIRHLSKGIRMDFFGDCS